MIKLSRKGWEQFYANRLEMIRSRRDFECERLFMEHEVDMPSLESRIMMVTKIAWQKGFEAAREIGDLA